MSYLLVNRTPYEEQEALHAAACLRAAGWSVSRLSGDIGLSPRGSCRIPNYAVTPPGDTPGV